mgnify:CR=1 FL=1
MAKVWNEQAKAYTWTPETKVAEDIVKEVVKDLPNEKWTKVKLVEWCGVHGVDEINSGDTKSDILDKIADACEE